MEKTIPFQEDPAEEGCFEAILSAAQDEECSECSEQAESVILHTYQLGGVWYYRARYICKEDLDKLLEVRNRYRECRRDASGEKRQDKCMDAKEKAEGFWKHQGKEDYDS